jgi:hypothetical protein
MLPSLPGPPPPSSYVPLSDPPEREPPRPSPSNEPPAISDPPRPPPPPPLEPPRKPAGPKVWPNVPPSVNGGAALYVIGFLTDRATGALRIGGWFFHGDVDICTIPPSWFKKSNYHIVPRTFTSLVVAEDMCDYQEVKGKSYAKSPVGETVGKLTCDHYGSASCAKIGDGKGGKSVTQCSDDPKNGDQAGWTLENGVTCAWEYSWSRRIVENGTASDANGTFTQLLRPVLRVAELPIHPSGFVARDWVF